MRGGAKANSGYSLFFPFAVCFSLIVCIFSPFSADVKIDKYGCFEARTIADERRTFLFLVQVELKEVLKNWSETLRQSEITFPVCLVGILKKF